jgi:hypothetical protein
MCRCSGGAAGRRGLHGEGCSVAAVTAATVLVNSPLDALDLLLNPKRLTATLRR